MTAEIVEHPEYATVCRTIDADHDHLVAHYQAHHLGVSKKYRGGEKLAATCVTFYVMRKGARHARHLVPPFLDLAYKEGSHARRIATDVCEILEQPVALSIRGGNAIFGADGEPGTVGLVFRQGDRDFLVTNAHVVTDPGVLPGPVTVRVPHSAVEIAGIVRRMDDLGAAEIRSDAALVEVALNAVAPGRFRGTDLILVGYGEIANNDPRRFFFVSKEFVHEARWAAWVPGGAQITVDGHDKIYASFHKLSVIVGQASPGNSGAVVFCLSKSGLVAVGLLFGGALAINEIWVFPIRRCLKQMGVDV